MNKIIWSNTTYNKFASLYDIFLGLFLPNKYRKVVVSYIKEGKVLDVACGTGELLKYADKKGLICYGIDLSLGMIKQASKKVKNGKFKQADFYAIPFEDNLFENVVATYALGGTKINVAKVLTEMLRVCRADGQIIILDRQKKQKENLLDKIFIKIARLTEDTPRDFAGLLSKLGCDVESRKLSNTYSVIRATKRNN